MQNILFISKDKPKKYPEIDKHYTWIPIHNNLSYEILSKFWHEYKPLAVYSFGSEFDQSILYKLFQVRKRWIHMEIVPDMIDVNPNIFSAMLGHQYDKANPLMSIITTSYHSKHKILRPLRSLQAQTYSDWEWIIWDDSEGDEQFKELLKIQEKDLRIRIFKAPYHSGTIGEMKRMAASMAWGSYIVEVDHDDDFHPDMLRWIKEAGEKHPDAGFFYTDCAELTEDIYTPATYGEFFGMGYCGHVFQWSDFHKCYVARAACAQPNPLTLTHIVGVPNHVRAWRTDFYDKIGKHNPLLSVADDYELILRSYLGGKWCYIRALAYYQYRNRDGNFTFIRNSLIQHNSKQIFKHYANKLPPITVTYTNTPQWQVDGNAYPDVHYTYLPDELKYDKVIVLNDPTTEDLNKELMILEKDSSIKYHIIVMGILPPIDPAWAKHISYWNLTSKDPKDRKRYVEKYIHHSGELVFRDLVFYDLGTTSA